ncbi:MAG: hypothetical protein QOK14_1493 [Frankiaceae bacterium]|nr:hypothetical protein [Frankiaceae bacterium]
MTQTLAQPRPVARQMLNKVPEVTVYFWIIKILATTVGESAADYINETLGFGLVKTSLLATAFLIAVLVWQFRLKRYVPGVYWLAVVLISVVGTLLTDNLHDGLHVGLLRSSTAFAVLLAITFALWYRSEGTLSIHSIVTTRREGFYWTAVLFTFALGTAAGDLLSLKMGNQLWQPAVVVAIMIVIVFLEHRLFHMDAIPSFWIAYILTRPLGANMGDFLASDKVDGGLGLGTQKTSLVFLAAILASVVYLTMTKRDQTELGAQAEGSGVTLA